MEEGERAKVSVKGRERGNDRALRGRYGGRNVVVFGSRSRRNTHLCDKLSFFLLEWRRSERNVRININQPKHWAAFKSTVAKKWAEGNGSIKST